MKRLLLIIVFALIVSGCEELQHGYVYIVPEENKEECRAWVKTCIEKANPMSDEEPEDMIQACLVAGSQLFGQCVLVEDKRMVFRGERCSLPVSTKEE